MSRRQLVTALIATAIVAPVLVAAVTIALEFATAGAECSDMPPVAIYCVLLAAGPLVVLAWSRRTALRWWERALGVILSLVVAFPAEVISAFFGAGLNNCLS